MIMFEWDEAKNTANQIKHDIDFNDAARAFDGRQEITAKLPYQTEERYVTIAFIEDAFVAVIWTSRNGKRRIISARRARDGEKREYRQLFN